MQKNVDIKQKTMNMHAYVIKYPCIYISTNINNFIKQKKKIMCACLIKYASIYNKHAQNYAKYTQNGAFTNGTP